MNNKTQNEKSRSIDPASEIDEACLRLEHIGKTMQDIAADQRAQPLPQKNWMALRGTAVFMSSLAHILSGFARIYWRMLPPDLRAAQVSLDSYPPVVEVKR